jgi:hypothetical protein
METASALLKQEYGFDKTELTTTFIELYVGGDLQSGALELSLVARWDRAHYFVVLSLAVLGEVECAVTVIFSCYDLKGASAKLNIVKAWVITNEQFKSSMMLFSHGGVINPHVMGNRLSHFAPVILKTDVSDEDTLDQICVVTQPGSNSKGDRWIIQSSMDLSKVRY